LGVLNPRKTRGVESRGADEGLRVVDPRKMVSKGIGSDERK